MKRKNSKPFFLGLALFCLVMAYASVVFGVPPGLSAIEGKATQVRDLVIALALIIVMVGAVWCGIKFVKGDQDAWGYVWKFALGAILVYAAPQIVVWLSSG